MASPDDGGFKAQRASLSGGCLFELDSGGRDAGDATAIKGVNVMQTARRARTSISQAFNHQICALDNILQDGFRRGLGVRRLFEADGFNSRRLNQRLQRIHELVGAFLGNRQQRDRLANQTGRRGQARAKPRRFPPLGRA